MERGKQVNKMHAVIKKDASEMTVTIRKDEIRNQIIVMKARRGFEKLNELMEFEIDDIVNKVAEDDHSIETRSKLIVGNAKRILRERGEEVTENKNISVDMGEVYSELEEIRKEKLEVTGSKVETVQLSKKERAENRRDNATGWKNKSVAESVWIAWGESDPEYRTANVYKDDKGYWHCEGEQDMGDKIVSFGDINMAMIEKIPKREKVKKRFGQTEIEEKGQEND